MCLLKVEVLLLEPKTESLLFSKLLYFFLLHNELIVFRLKSKTYLLSFVIFHFSPISLGFVISVF